MSKSTTLYQLELSHKIQAIHVTHKYLDNINWQIDAETGWLSHNKPQIDKQLGRSKRVYYQLMALVEATASGVGSLKTHNQQDTALIESLCPNEYLAFKEWFDALNEANQKSLKYGSRPLEVSTGIHCWFDYFTDGYGPDEALLEDLKNQDQCCG